MSNYITQKNGLANQCQDMVPLTPEIARFIDQLLTKNAAVLADLMADTENSIENQDIQRQKSTA